MHENETGTIIVDTAVHLHQALGPGWLESVYEIVFRPNLVVEDKVIVELKSVEIIKPVHKKQLLTYLRLTGMKSGYLLNFGAVLMNNGITRTINGTL